MGTSKEARCYGGFAFARIPTKNKGATAAEVLSVPSRFGVETVRGRSVMFRSDHGAYAVDRGCWRASTMCGIGRESTAFNSNSSLRKNYLNNYRPMHRR
jgi:hypothetical protein